LAEEHRGCSIIDGLSFAEGEQIVRWRIDQFSDMTLRRGVVQGMAELRVWLEAGDLRSITVSLCDADGVPAVSWRVQKALPVALEAPALQADSNSAAVETLQLKVAGISVETH
jgi:phage tail-like protein